MTDSIYEKLSKERKDLQAQGLLPEFFTTGGWQMFKQKYMFDVDSPKDQYKRIAKTAASHIKVLPDWWGGKQTWEDAFFKLLWSGDLSPSSPVLANTGTDRGLPVSCSGGYVGDSVDSFYKALHESAILTKHGFGTSGYFGDIRPRGSLMSGGGKASGVLPVIQAFVQMSRDISQGSQRRGAYASYLPIEHGDFHEVVAFVEATPDDCNISWSISDEFIQRLDDGDAEALSRYQAVMRLKMLTGRGYIFKVDEANRHAPDMYKDKGFKVRASNLCSETSLHSSETESFTCVLSSMNASRWSEWKDSEAVFIATVFLDCIAQEFIDRAENISGLEKAISFTKKGRALGLGVAGFHTYLQKNMIAFESLEAHLWNNTLFKHIKDESDKASKWMAVNLGEPEWCVGYGVRNTHTVAVAPTKSTALIMGGISEGINPDPAMTYTQLTPAGEINRANPQILELMKSKGLYDKKHFQQLVDAQGSVQNVDWLSDYEKLVFKTAFEIDQSVIIRYAASRQRFINQSASTNLFFSNEEDEGYISKIHQDALKNPNIISLYYCYSKRGVTASKGECLACQ